jgi:hypothetical protein
LSGFSKCGDKVLAAVCHRKEVGSWPRYEGDTPLRGKRVDGTNEKTNAGQKNRRGVQTSTGLKNSVVQFVFSVMQ